MSAATGQATSELLWELREQAERHTAFTRPLFAPYDEPWRGYWREAARDLQRTLDRAVAELERLADS